MLGLIRNVVLALLTFVIGLTFQSFEVPKATLEEISKDTASYDGQLVEVESYIYLTVHDDATVEWMLGEPFEKSEVWVHLSTESNSVDLSQLQRKLTTDYSLNQYNRAKVSVLGRVRDDCLDRTCCFTAGVITIEQPSITQIGPVENYSIPASFIRKPRPTV